MAVAVLAMALGLAVAYLFYILNPKLADTTAETLAAGHRVLKHKYFVDEIYDAAVVRPLHWLSDRIFWQAVDVGLVDAAVNGAASQARGIGQTVRQLQSGNTRSYAAWVILGAVVVLSYFIFG